MLRLPIVPLVLTAGIFALTPAFSQTSSTSAQQQEHTSVNTGTVVSATTRTMVVRTESGQYVLFVFDRDTIRPRSIPAGSRVRVRSSADQEGTQVATAVTVTSPPAPQQGAAAASDEPIPPEIRRVERDIERQVRRFRGGVRAGVGLDPELVLLGAQATLGPFFHRDVFFRPNLELGFGEVTTMGALNLEAVYRLPFTPRHGRWSAYLGAGPGFAFVHRNFEEAQSGDRKIDFGEFDFDPGLNVLAGVEFRSGMFIELKSSAYSNPTLRMMLGYNF